MNFGLAMAGAAPGNIGLSGNGRRVWAPARA